MTIAFVFVILALICFLGAIFDWPEGKSGRLLAAGLFLWLLSTLVGKG